MNTIVMMFFMCIPIMCVVGSKETGEDYYISSKQRSLNFISHNRK